MAIFNLPQDHSVMEVTGEFEVRKGREKPQITQNYLHSSSRTWLKKKKGKAFIMTLLVILLSLTFHFTNLPKLRSIKLGRAKI